MAKILVWLSVAALHTSAGHQNITIIDTHVHNAFLSPHLSYSFPKAFPDLGRRTWNMSDFVAASGLHSGISAILMELDKEGDIYDQSLLEAKKFQEVAEHCRASRGFCSVSGIVASAPVTEGAEVMRKFLPELIRIAPMVRAVREALWHRDASSFMNISYLDSLRQLAIHGLALDLLVNRTQLDDLAKIAAALPELKININHLAYPNIRGSEFDRDWGRSMVALAKLPNVYVKLSGLPQAYGGYDWSPSDFQPYISFTLKMFGAHRINFAGNWFILNEFGDYRSMLAAVTKCLSAELDSSDMSEVMSGTAKRFYRLSDDVAQLQEYLV